MEYTVNKLAEISGVTKRTLRYYDEIGLLKPTRINTSGYRIYGKNEVNRLQQILLYRAMGVSLDAIKQIMTSESYDVLNALKSHREKLLEQRAQLEQLILTIDQTIAENEGRTTMSDKSKFEGLKKSKLEENEALYGSEIREKYGEETVAKSNSKFMEMNEESHEKAMKLATEIIDQLMVAMDSGDTGSEASTKLVELHKSWLMIYWPTYTYEAHVGLGEMYVNDNRFKIYYDQHREGAAQFLCDAIKAYAGL